MLLWLTAAAVSESGIFPRPALKLDTTADCFISRLDFFCMIVA